MIHHRIVHLGAAVRLAPLVISLGTVALTQSGEFWEKKDYTQWAERECKRLLENSPWARSYTLSRVFIAPLEQNEPAERNREPNPRIQYQLQFRSALPIRQALTRLQQITAKYDHMPPEEKAAFDKSAGEFLAKTFPDSVVVYVQISSNVPQYEMDLSRHWQTQTVDTLRNVVFLIGSKGEKVPLQQYFSAPAGRAFQFVFPRSHNGQPVIGPDDKRIQIEFPHPTIREIRSARVLVEFKTDKMVLGGSLVY